MNVPPKKETILMPCAMLRPAHRCGCCRRQLSLQSVLRPPDKSFRKEDGGRGGKEKSPFSKGGASFLGQTLPLPSSFPASHLRRNHSQARQAFVPGASLRLLPTATIAPISSLLPLIKVFGKRMGGAGGRRKALFQKGFLLPPAHPPLFLKKKLRRGGK